MRIVHISATFPPQQTGTGVVCYQNALALAQRGHQVSVITAQYPLDGWQDPAELQVRRLPALLRIGNAPLLPGLLDVGQVDLIHLHHPFIFGAEIVWAVARLRHIPYVLTHHNDLIGDGARTHLFAAYSSISGRVVPAGASKFAVVSHDHAYSCGLAPLFQRRAADVVEIPNGVDVELFQPGLDPTSLRRRLGVPDGSNVLLFVGALDRAHHMKGVTRLLTALAEMAQKDAVLVVVGDGDLRERYEADSVRLGVAGRVRFAGTVQHAELPLYYAASDVLVLPSSSESFGIVLIEAMACGRPVVTYDVPGARAVVSDGEDGLLVPCGTTVELAHALDLLLGNATLRARMGIAGRRKVCAGYTWPAIAERLEQLYAEALESHGIGRRMVRRSGGAAAAPSARPSRAEPNAP
jgi:glycosyltransferase involved in cell wall biosynthesis